MEIEAARGHGVGGEAGTPGAPAAGGGGASSALSEAVRRLRTGNTPSPPGKHTAVDSAVAGGLQLPRGEGVVAGAMSVLARAQALHAAHAGHGHLEPACILSPRANPGGVSVRLGGKGAHPATVKLSSKDATESVQRI